MADDIAKGASVRDIAETHPVAFIKFNKGIVALKTALAPDRRGVAPEVHIFWGESGTGKSRKAFEEFPDAHIMSKPNNGAVWFDGYDGQDVIIFDEFYGWIPYDMLLRILDWHAISVPVKGAMVKLAATKFVFTSNKPWEEWYPNVDDTKALARRIKEFCTDHGRLIKFKSTKDAFEEMKKAAGAERLRKLEARMAGEGHAEKMIANRNTMKFEREVLTDDEEENDLGFA